MVLNVVEFCANLENIQSISLPEHHTFCIDVKDSTGDDVRENVRVNDSEEQDIPNSRGTAHFALKWAKDSRKVSYLHVVPIKGVTRPVTGEDDSKPVPIVAFDCRGLDVIKWHPEDGFEVVTASGKTFEDVDLSSGEWVEYDEDLSESVGIYDITSQITTRKQ
ncbi:hypothetical protein WJX84_009249 [Apatococcus fuscideae]|uniref:Uncharacterized protein n=1 Tax=Apatococcus fuscideae TaxID=2026836 RepID=A0AAW1RZ66_9CHLO